MKLTSANVPMPPGKRDAVIFDDTLHGFGLRIRIGSGDKLLRSWIIQTRMQGRMRRMMIGSAAVLTAAQARRAAQTLLAKIKLGADPASERNERRQKDTMSLRFVASEFLSHKGGVRRNTMESLRRYLETGPYLGSLRSMPVDRVTRRDIATRLLAVSKDHGVRTALSFRSALSGLYSWAMMTGLAEGNPLVGTYKPETPKPRERVLDDRELTALWRALEDDPYDYGKILRLMILSGARRNEIGGMTWAELNDDDTWTLPSERSKNKRSHTLPLTPLMQEIIGSVPSRYETDQLFGVRGRGFSQWGPGKQMLDERLGHQMKEWQLRDLRRSTATGMANIGIQPHIIEQILNHQRDSKSGVAGVYNRSPYEREVRDAMLRWSTHIAEIIGAEERKVLSFEQRAAATQ
jgi:integrase